MAVAVVDVLEPVEVGDDERERPAEALEAGELGGKRLLALPAVRQTGEAVDERLPLDDAVQPRVVERHDRVRRERDGGHPVLVLEVVAEEQERAEGDVAGGQRNLDLVAAPSPGRPAWMSSPLADDDHAARRAGRLDSRLDDQRA